MANPTQNPNGKRALIDKANNRMVITVAISGFLIVFCLVACRALWAQRSHQSQVISEKEKAVKQLKANITAVDKLATSYKEFVGTPDNVLGGNPNGTGDKDGNNAKIVLDALPSKYDFPAFITSIENLLQIKGFELASITGTDDEVAQSQTSDSGKKSEPVEIPFEMQVTTDSYQKVQLLLTTLEKSIRPIKATSLELTGGQGEAGISVTLKGVSYYQPAQGLSIEKKVIQ